MSTIIPLPPTCDSAIAANLAVLATRHRRCASLAGDAATAAADRRLALAAGTVMEIETLLAEIEALTRVALLLLRSARDATDG